MTVKPHVTYARIFVDYVLFTFTAPSAAPIELSIVSQTSTSLTLSWAPLPPENRNGIITGYSINVTHNNTGNSMHLSSTEEFIIVESLSPYTVYLCSVAAQTAVGLGPYTPPLTARTDEDGT